MPVPPEETSGQNRIAPGWDGRKGSSGVSSLVYLIPAPGALGAGCYPDAIFAYPTLVDPARAMAGIAMPCNRPNACKVPKSPLR